MPDDEARGPTPEAPDETGVRLRLHGRVRVQSFRAGAHERASKAPGGPADLDDASRLWSLACVEQDNVVCTVGKTAILHLIASDGAALAGLQYIAVGTGGGTPAAGDTALSAELARAPLTSVAVSGSTVTGQIFFSSAQANGTWTEVGCFGNGATASAGSGTLFGHAALSYTKNSTLETIVSYSFTLT